MSEAVHLCGATLAGFGPFPEVLAIGTGLAATTARWAESEPGGMDLRVQGRFAADLVQDSGLMLALEQRLAKEQAANRAVVIEAGTPVGVGLHARLAARVALERLLASRGEDEPAPRPGDGEAPPSAACTREGPEVLLAAREGGVTLRGRPHPPEAFTLGPLPCALGIVLPLGLRAPERLPLPEPLAPMRAAAAARRQVLLVQSILGADAEQFGAHLADPNFFPAAARRIPGAFPALAAAMEAGALGGFLPSGGPALAVLARDEVIDAACRAASETFAAHRLECEVWSAPGVSDHTGEG